MAVMILSGFDIPGVYTHLCTCSHMSIAQSPVDHSRHRVQLLFNKMHAPHVTAHWMIWLDRTNRVWTHISLDRLNFGLESIPRKILAEFVGRDLGCPSTTQHTERPRCLAVADPRRFDCFRSQSFPQTPSGVHHLEPNC